MARGRLFLPWWQIRQLCRTHIAAATHGLDFPSDSNTPACPLYHPVDRDQQDRADESSNEVAEPSSKANPKEIQNGAGNRGPDDTEHDIHQESHITLHELFCEPARNPADDDRCNPAYLCFAHCSSPWGCRNLELSSGSGVSGDG